MQKSAYGFTLVELMVVIAIMAVIGAYTLSNYRSFGEDQNLKNAVLDIQSQLRAAQTSATANAICSSQSGATWQLAYNTDKTTVNLNCQEPLPSPLPSPLPTPTSKKTWQLGANITIDTIAGSDLNCPSNLPFFINFEPLSGKINIGGYNCPSLSITLKNNNTGGTKQLNIDQGGRIYGQ